MYIKKWRKRQRKPIHLRDAMKPLDDRQPADNRLRAVRSYFLCLSVCVYCSTILLLLLHVLNHCKMAAAATTTRGKHNYLLYCCNSDLSYLPYTHLPYLPTSISVASYSLSVNRSFTIIAIIIPSSYYLPPPSNVTTYLLSFFFAGDCCSSILCRSYVFLVLFQRCCDNCQHFVFVFSFL